MIFPNLVIGSGPSGISAAYALAKKGVPVTILDAGYTLEQKRKKIITSLSQKQPREWGQDAAILNENMSAGINGVSEKKVFGSNFSSKNSAEFKITSDNAFFYTSLAKGGLSNLWGRGIEPITREDAIDWPITYNELAPYYEKILEFVPLTASRDGLIEKYPLFTSKYTQPPLSDQAKILINYFNKNALSLKENGFAGGVSRVAASYENNEVNCNLCGKCLLGCPYGLLYSTTDTLDTLCATTDVKYIGGLIVDFIEENNEILTIHCKDINSGEKVFLKANKVYLATGPIPSAKILMKSLGMYSEKLIIKNSDLIFIPSLLRTSAKNVVDEDKVTASLISMLLSDKTISDKMISMHFYLNNELYEGILQNLAGIFQRPATPVINLFLNRFIMIFAFLHSNISSHLEANLDKKSNTMHIKGVKNKKVEIAEKNIRRKLMSNSKLTGFFPIPFYKDKNLPGSSIHSGASFPMGSASDILGRPNGFNNLHVVDATVLPDIPSGSFTFTVMANAYRIAEQS